MRNVCPKGEGHNQNEKIGCNEYMAQMILFEDEGKSDTFLGAAVSDAPKELFLVGDVELAGFKL